jgi:hypothetical protein
VGGGEEREREKIVKREAKKGKEKKKTRKQEDRGTNESQGVPVEPAL